MIPREVVLRRVIGWLIDLAGVLIGSMIFCFCRLGGRLI